MERFNPLNDYLFLKLMGIEVELARIIPLKKIAWFFLLFVLARGKK